MTARAGLAQFSGDPRIEWHLNTHTSKEAVMDAAKNLPYKGGNTLTGTDPRPGPRSSQGTDGGRTAAGPRPQLASAPDKVAFTSCKDSANQLTGLHEASGASWSSWSAELWCRCCCGGGGAPGQAQVGVRGHLRAGGLAGNCMTCLLSPQVWL